MSTHLEHSKRATDARLTRDVAPGIHKLEHANVNCYLIEEDDRLTLVDTAFPDTWPLLLRAIDAIGRRPADVAAIVLTHAHFDRFDPDAVWPREDVPRVLPGAIRGLLSNMNKADSRRLHELLASGKTFGGTVSASAKILGKNYMKQVDVVMSDWDTGPELLISTKRMDDSYTNNAPNRMEESYGDAKNLRSRHPRAALGFVFSLRANAFDEAPRAAAWILDLLAKLGREEDAYDAVALVIPRYSLSEPAPVANELAVDRGSRSVDAGLVMTPEEEPIPAHDDAAEQLYQKLQRSEAVDLDLASVPSELSPATFFNHMVRHVLDNSPITRHEEARERLKRVLAESAGVGLRCGE